MEKLSDDFVMSQVQSGHVRLAGLLFERYKKMLYAFFYNQTYSKTLCDDLIQDTFYRLIKYKHNYKSGNSFKAWLFTIARNTMIDELRKKGKKKMQDVEIYKEQFVEEKQADFDLKRKEKHLFLHKALQTLSSDKREILTLVKLQELKYKEVANILNISESAVKSRVFRAVAELQNQFNAHANMI